MNPLISPSLSSFRSPVVQPAASRNFLNTSNHFHALEMATFDPIPYTYAPTAPCSKSAAIRRQPALMQVSIFDKIQRIKSSSTLLSTARPAEAVAAADDNRGDKRSKTSISCNSQKRPRVYLKLDRDMERDRQAANKRLIIN
jgi:hypothetical protein